MRRRSILQALLAVPLLLCVSQQVRAALPRRRGTHTNIQKMFDAIVNHCRKTGDKILSSDHPRDLLIGFAAISEVGIVTEEWSISVRDLQNSIRKLRYAPEGKALIQQCLQTGSGRAKLAMSFPYQGQRRLSA